MTRILGIAGSLRTTSYNAALLRAAASLVPAGCDLVVGSIEGIPLYDGDSETAGGIPGPVTRLKEHLSGAAGLLLVTPEYNNSRPGVLKNAIDWMSRPPKDIATVFRGKPVGVMGATPGAMGTVLAQSAWLPVLRALGTRPWFGVNCYVSGADKVFDKSGKLVDAAVAERVKKYLAGFVEFVHKLD